MRILVGILHCIENEFDQCLAAIDSQTYKLHERFIISNLPNKAAHDKLYQTFMDRAHEFELFVKIDADMVLSRETFFEELVQRFQAELSLEHLQIKLDDWMTGCRIFALHAYRNSYRWIENDEAHFVDMVEANRNCVLDSTHLTPAAVHCPDPSPFQAFHFGVHKATKVLQLGRPQIKVQSSATHWKHFANLESLYHRTNEPRLALAVLGFLHAIRHGFGPSQVDYDSEDTRVAFEEYASMSHSEREAAMKQFGYFASPRIPHRIRFELALHANRTSRRRLDLLRLINNCRRNRLQSYV